MVGIYSLIQNVLRNVYAKFAITTFFLVIALSACHVQNNEKKVKPMSMETLFENLLTATGEHYLDQESQLLKGGEDAIAVLTSKLQHNDTYTRIYAKTMLDWLEGKSPNINIALDYLEALPGELAYTALGSPSALPTSSYLDYHYTNTVTNILGIRIIKLPELPRWYVLAVIFHIKSQTPPKATNLLLRFAIETNNEEWRNAALEAITEIQDPQLNVKIAEEKSRLASSGRGLPEFLDALIAKP